MSFFNQKNILLYDQLGNLCHFRWDEGKIRYIYFDQDLGEYDRTTLVEDCGLEFDATIDEKDNIYFIYQRIDGDLLLMVHSKEKWETSVLGGFEKGDMVNVNILEHNGKIHILYCISSSEVSHIYKVYHHFYDGMQWNSNQLGEIRKKTILNPFQFIKSSEYLLFGFYNTVNNEEQIFIKWFDTIENQWQNTMKLTNNFNDKLYLDILISRDGKLHLAYSEYDGGNLVIKYEKYNMQENKISQLYEHILSNPANCSYPSFVMQPDRLWVVWTEYDQIMSCFSTDQGLTWSQPYLWKNSKEYNFFRYKFITNNKGIEENYKISYAFGKDYPEFSLLGFGNMEKALEVPKKKDEIIEEKNNKPYSRKEINKIPRGTYKNQNGTESSNNELNRSATSDLYKKVEILEERVQDIEDYILRRRRGGLFSLQKR